MRNGRRGLGVVATALAIMISACGGDSDGGVGGERSLPLSSEERCQDDGPKVGCVLGEPVPAGTSLTDDDMVVVYRGSSFESGVSDDPVNTSSSRALGYVTVTNTGERALQIWDYDDDLRFDGDFRRSGSDLDDCGVVPAHGEIEPGDTVTIRFCGYLETVGDIMVDELALDFEAQCSSCEALLAVDAELVDPSAVDDVAASVERMSQAGYGTPAELGLGELTAEVSNAAEAGNDSGDREQAGSAPPVESFLPPPPPVATMDGVDASADQSGGEFDTDADSDVVVTTTTLPDATPTPDLILRADGIGSVSFDRTLDETVAAFTQMLGVPDLVGDPLFEPAIGTIVRYQWGRLAVVFTGGSQLYFTSYELGRNYEIIEVDNGDFAFELETGQLEGWEHQMTTAEGLAIDDSEAELTATYADVYVATCDGDVAATSIADVVGTTDQLFVADRQAGLYVRAPIDGVVWAIGAQVQPNYMLCDGGSA